MVLSLLPLKIYALKQGLSTLQKMKEIRLHFIVQYFLYLNVHLRVHNKKVSLIRCLYIIIDEINYVITMNSVTTNGYNFFQEQFQTFVV